MSYKCHITVALIIIVGVDDLVDIFFCFRYTCKLFGVEVNEIHGIAKLFVKEGSVIFIEKLTLCDI